MSETMPHIRRWSVLIASIISFSAYVRAQTNACDLVQPYGIIDSADVQAAVNMALGLSTCTAKIAGTGVCNVVVVQRVVNATLPGGTCRVDGAIQRSVFLSWNASTSSAVVGYNVYRGTTAGGVYTKQNSSPVLGTTYTDTTVQSGQTYYYVTTALNSSGKESIYSNEAKAAVDF